MPSVAQLKAAIPAVIITLALLKFVKPVRDFVLA
jgi:hypothetical protein